MNRDERNRSNIPPCGHPTEHHAGVKYRSAGNIVAPDRTITFKKEGSEDVGFMCFVQGRTITETCTTQQEEHTREQVEEHFTDSFWQSIKVKLSRFGFSKPAWAHRWAYLL